MGSEWHLRGHLSEPRHFSSQTLPSVAALIASTDPAYHQTTSSVPPAALDRPAPRNTLPYSTDLAAPASAVTAADRLPWNSVNHTSPRVRQVVVGTSATWALTFHGSPTNTTRLPTIAPEHYHNQPPVSQSTTSTLDVPLTSGSPRRLQDAAYSQTPINSQRQDSATFQRIDIPKDPQPIAASPNSTFASFYRSPNDRQPSISPRPNSIPTTPSSLDSAVTETLSAQDPAKSEAYSPRQPHTNSLYSRNQGSWVPAKSNEHVPGRHSASDPKSMLISSTSEQSQSTHTRQQRYNVRFAANYTSENMPSTQKPRQDAHVPPVPPSEVTESPPVVQERPITPPMEPSLITRIQNMTQPVVEASSSTRNRDSNVPMERCETCHEVWRRPPFSAEQTGTRQAENSADIARNSLHLFAIFHEHCRKEQAMYDQWVKKHNHCAYDPQRNGLSRPSVVESQDDTRTVSANGTSRSSGLADAPVRKRKADTSDESERQPIEKSRKIDVESEPEVAPTVSTPASA